MINILKKIFLLTLPFAIISCHNVEREFDDFGLTTVCFPYQTPVRTIILGEYEQGFNDNDNNHCFEIGVSLSGLYKNKEDRYVEVEIDNSLTDGLTNVTSLPSSHYEILTQNPVIIPKGSMKGRIKIQLTDAFFDDPEAISPDINTVNYVLPLRIKSIDKIDSLLCGKPAVDIPHPCKPGDWEVLPKDYTLYGIKYINPYDGYFLRRGVDKITDAAGKETTITYKQKYVENDEKVRTRTESLTCTVIPSHIRRPDNTKTDHNIKVNFKSNTECDVLDSAGNKIGTGKYLVDGDEWGGKKRDAMHISYSFTDSAHNERHDVDEILVMRDRDIVFEKFVPLF